VRKLRLDRVLDDIKIEIVDVGDERADVHDSYFSLS